MIGLSVSKILLRKYSPTESCPEGCGVETEGAGGVFIFDLGFFVCARIKITEIIEVVPNKKKNHFFLRFGLIFIIDYITPLGRLDKRF